MLSRQIGALLALAAAAAAKTTQIAHQEPQLGQITSWGCYSELGDINQNNKTIAANTNGLCGQHCQKLHKNTAAFYATQCWCGDKYPPKSSKVDDSKCNEPCPGYDQVACGGPSAYSILNLGEVTVVEFSPEPKESTSTTSSATTKPTQTSGGATSANPGTETQVPDSSNKPQATADSGPSTTATIGIAVGAVAGVLLICGIAGGAWFYRRQRRNSEIEEEHRRNAAVNAFIGGGKPPSTSSGLSMSDARLDPVFANRRMSDGSIDDNQDYSRRILRVTNA